MKKYQDIYPTVLALRTIRQAKFLTKKRILEAENQVFKMESDREERKAKTAELLAFFQQYFAAIEGKLRHKGKPIQLVALLSDNPGTVAFRVSGRNKPRPGDGFGELTVLKSLPPWVPEVPWIYELSLGETNRKFANFSSLTNCMSCYFAETFDCCEEETPEETILL